MRRLSTAIESAVPTIPSVLADLISQYAYRRPHAWTDGPFQTRDGKIVPNAWSAVRVTENVTELRHIGPAVGWHTFVSTETVRTGATSWTVDVSLADCVFVGVSTVPENYFGLLGLTSFPAFSLTSIFGKIQKLQNKESLDIGDFVQSPIRFDANPITRQITATMAATGDKAIVLATAANDDEFDALRPFVALARTAGAVLVSG